MSQATSTRYRTLNWRSHNDALRKRGSLTVWFDPAMVWHAEPSGKRGEQAIYSNAAIQACLTIKVLFGLPLRQTTGFVASLLAERRADDSHDRRDLPQGAPHGFQPAVEKRGRKCLIGRTKGGMNTKLHAVTDSLGRPIRFFMSAGQVSDYVGARAMMGGLPLADWLIADRGYDADWFRDALEDKGIRACIPGRKSRDKPVRYDKRRYKRRNRIEIMFGRLKD